MRGKPNPGCHDARGFRIIPAHAGQTSSPDLNWASTTDHPRACGANVSSDGMLSRCTGSSPRMRGKPVYFRRRRLPSRIIPAHAGQTPCSRPCRCSPSDHPRACGANLAGEDDMLYVEGSSPRMRGKQARPIQRARGLRIIPAHAGQTRRSSPTRNT